MQQQTIYNISEICRLHGINKVVISPGSRNALLTISFARNSGLQKFIIPDERSAAYVAMGIAQSDKDPVALVCTSGTAALNYGPAVAEAYYLKIPLLVLTADRPPEWIDQHDGQTVRQVQLFENHVRASYSQPIVSTAEDRWLFNRQLNEAIRLTQNPVPGPVHLNVPVREPFYPQKEEQLSFSSPLRIVTSSQAVLSLNTEELDSLKKQVRSFKRILIVPGQQPVEQKLRKMIEKLCEKIPVAADIISNFSTAKGIIRTHDSFLSSLDEDQKKRLQPDLLITFGESVIAKQLKLFLRSFPATEHWNIQNHTGQSPDTFQSLSHIIYDSPLRILKEVIKENELSPDNNYVNQWKLLDQSSQNTIKELQPADDFSELEAFKTILSEIPDNCVLHLANSMAVRYANIIGIQGKDIEVFSNRGTSGIDGCNSTAIGHAITNPEKQHILITGDMAFLYDKNAFWHNHHPSNLSVFVVNNFGGGIFRLIDGPANQPELDEYFDTVQKRTAQKTAEEYGFDYIACKDVQSCEQATKHLQTKKGITIIEVFTNKLSNENAFKIYKQEIKNSIQQNMPG